MKRHTLPLTSWLVFLCLSAPAFGQSESIPSPQNRLMKGVDDHALVTLHGNVHPLVASATASATVDGSTPMEHMVLLLKGDAAQEAQLTAFVAAQHDPKSSLYHQFLTPEEFGVRFGVTASDIGKITGWLENHGLKVDQVTAGRRSIVFSGTVGEVASAFGTEIKRYTVGGEAHYANASDPTIPSALAAVVGGVVKLHNFQHTAHMTKVTAVTGTQLAHPLYTYGSAHYLSPADYSTIYNIGPVYSAGINGTGQAIAILARSNINLSDVSSFRNNFGLKANNPQIVITNHDPGIVQGDSTETTLDTEWSGAVAPNATVKVIVAASTNTADGIDLSAIYAVNNNVAPIVSLSYGSCEAGMGSTEVAFYNSLWQQAAAQGMSVMVSAGDSGAAGCSGGSASSGSGRAINGLCSSPYATCVGGTEFAEGSNPGQYWLPGNNPTLGSAISYLPETVWNESGSNGGSGLWAGGGGASISFSKPTWQVGPGVPADGKRDVPDVSLTASSHDGYLITINGSLSAVGGTSASAPSFAGLMALVDQKASTRQGLANAILYPLAAKQAAGGAEVFHDITGGNNSVPGVQGFSATVGYDAASGLGSVDANQLINHWADGSNAAVLSLSTVSSTLTVPVGQSEQVVVTSSASAALKTTVTLTVAGAPTGVTAAFTPSTIPSPGSGAANLKVTAGTSVTPGTYSLTITGTGGGQSAKSTVSLVITNPTFTLNASPVSATVTPGNSAQVGVTTASQNGFSSSVTLTAGGLPSGVTAAFSPAIITGTAGGTSTLTLSVAKGVKAGSYSLTVSAIGGGVTKTSAVVLVVSATPSCTLSINPTSVNLTAGQAAGVQIACGAAQGTFANPLTLSISGLPTGVSGHFANSTLSPGSIGALSFSSLPSTPAGSYTISLSATGSGFSQTLSIPLTISTPSSFTLTGSLPTLTIKPGSAGQVTVTSVHVGAFNSAINLSVTGLPAGVTASLSKTSLAAPGDGTIIATLTAGPTAPQGSFPVAVVGSGGGITESAPVVLTVASVKPDFSFAVNSSSLQLQEGTPSNPLIISIGNFSGGFNSTITLMFSGVPVGMNYSNTAANTSNNLINISFAFSGTSALATGSYPITITASGAGVVHSAIVQITVTKPSQTTHLQRLHLGQ